MPLSVSQIERAHTRIVAQVPSVQVTAIGATTGLSIDAVPYQQQRDGAMELAGLTQPTDVSYKVKTSTISAYTITPLTTEIVVAGTTYIVTNKSIDPTGALTTISLREIGAYP